MPLIVDYKKRVGYYTLNQNGNKFKVHFCRANCLMAEIYFYKGEDGQRHGQLQGMFSDIAHMKRCAKAGIFNQMENIVFFNKEMDKNLWEMVKVYSGLGIKVTIK